jgi:hypothetical protein
MKTVVLILLGALLTGLAPAFSQDRPEGELRVYQDRRVDTLLNRYANLNEKHPVIEGWRIEIFFEAGNYSKKQAMEARAEFVKSYPEVPSSVSLLQR